jgi:hypothetical protein
MPWRPIEKKCEWCGKPWMASSPKVRTCSPTCRALLRETEKPSPGRGSREYPESIIRQVQELYADGATVAEIGEAIGPGYRAQTLVERFVETRRKTAKRNQHGPRNDSWRGDEAGYSAMHLRVITARGRPKRCACCDTTDPGIIYHWANLTGHYEDIRDYARLCPSCHRRLDARRRAQLGQPTMSLMGGGRDV